MNPATVARDRRLRALGVAPLRLRARGTAGSGTRAPGLAVRDSGEAATLTPAHRIERLALLADMSERGDPAIDRMYVALTDAVGKAGLQPVRVCDVAGDPSAALLVFGALPAPDGVPAGRVLRTDPLAALHADRDCKRRLWERLRALGRGGAGS